MCLERRREDVDGVEMASRRRVEKSHYHSVTASGVRLNQVRRWRKFYYQLENKLDMRTSLQPQE